MSRTPQEAARYLLSLEMPEDPRQAVNEKYGLNLIPGITNGQALIERVKKDAENGVKEAQELIQEIKVHGLE